MDTAQTCISVKGKSLMIDHLNILFRYCFAGVSQLWYYITSYMQVKPAVDMKI